MANTLRLLFFLNLSVSHKKRVICSINDEVILHFKSSGYQICYPCFSHGNLCMEIFFPKVSWTVFIIYLMFMKPYTVMFYFLQVKCCGQHLWRCIGLDHVRTFITWLTHILLLEYCYCIAACFYFRSLFCIWHTGNSWILWKFSILILYIKQIYLTRF